MIDEGGGSRRLDAPQRDDDDLAFLIRDGYRFKYFFEMNW